MKWTTWMAALGGAVVTSVAAVLAGAVLALRPAPDEWGVRVAGIDASVPTLIRWASHPLARPHLAGRTIDSRLGRWTLAPRGDGAIEARCAPCRLAHRQFGDAPLSLDEARLVIHPRGADRYDGTLHAGPGVVVAWQANVRRSGVALQARLAPTPVANVVAALALPEAGRVQAGGTVAFTATASIGARGLVIERVVPVFAAVEVHGLGTEALADADVRGRCRPQPEGGRIEGWIRNAVVAAEDQAFLQHPGYDIDAWQAAWKQNAASGDVLQGASTITMQLAKILYTGDRRSLQRKASEWLYAVEMERTLGKARILQLYLAVLPWGDGVCGAEAAARHHVGKSANQLKPHEAAWLASLLVNPDAQLRRWSTDEAAARSRVEAILHGMRRLSAERRDAEIDALSRFAPPVSRLATSR